MQRRKGFTLVELLISIVLMIIIVGICATIFRTTSTAYTIGEARIKMYVSARAAMDIIERDVISSLPSTTGAQRFFLANDYVTGGNGETITRGGNGERDAMLFRTISTTAGSLKVLIVGYYLEPESDPELGDPVAGATVTRVFKRRLFVLRRQMYELTDGPPRRPQTPDSPCDLAHFILSFNIETLYDPDGPDVLPLPEFCQLDQPQGRNSPITTNFYRTTIDYQVLRTNILNRQFIDNDFTTSDYRNPYPLGNDIPNRNPDDGVTDIKPACIRITMRMVDGAREVQERIIQREIWIPVR